MHIGMAAGVEWGAKTRPMPASQYPFRHFVEIQRAIPKSGWR